MSDIAIDAMDAMPGEDFFLEEEAAPDGAQGQAAEGKNPRRKPRPSRKQSRREPHRRRGSRFGITTRTGN